MHLIFERSNGRIRSNCNILALAWMPYYVETKFRQALLDYHQKQLINLGRTQNQRLMVVGNNSNPLERHDETLNNNNNNSNNPEQENQANGSRATNLVHLVDSKQFLNSRLAELHQRYNFMNTSSSNGRRNIEQQPNQVSESDVQSIARCKYIDQELGQRYGRLSEFGWLVVGNVGKTVGVTLTSTIAPPREVDDLNSRHFSSISQEKSSTSTQHQDDTDLMVFNDDDIDSTICDSLQYNSGPLNAAGINSSPSKCKSPRKQLQPKRSVEFELLRPDKRYKRSNYNLGGHLDEIILVRWNELYQKLATVDSKGNVLIWCKVNEKFTIQTPFYNRTKSVADFRWSNDGKTALICYTDSFILIGSSSGQRHWHSMLNLDEYHITCACWTPNDDQLLLGVSNGNVVVIDLPQSELTELVVSQVNIRTICWSSYEMNLNHLTSIPSPRNVGNNNNNYHQSRRNLARTRNHQFNSAIVNQRRLDRDCSLFSRYRFCSQAPNEGAPRVVDGGNTSAGTSITNHDLPIGEMNLDKIITRNGNKPLQTSQRNILAIEFANNTIKLYNGGLEDPEPKLIQVNLESFLMAWSTDGRYLAVAGFNIHTSAMSIDCLRCRYLNSLKFYNQQGELFYEYTMKYTRYPITAFTWAHNDQRVFVATGPRLHCAKLFQGIPKLSLLAMSRLHHETRLPDKFDVLECLTRGKFSAELLNWQSFNCPIETRQQQNFHNKTFDYSSDRSSSLITDESNDTLIMDLKTSINNANVLRYELPVKLKLKLDELFAQTIRKPIDDQLSLTDIIWHVPKNQQRYHCTLICYTNDSMDKDSGSFSQQYRSDLLDSKANSQATDHYKVFVLYIEFEGSLIPILRARRIGYLKPEFVLFDPEDGPSKCLQRSHRVSDISNQAFTSSSLSATATTCNSSISSNQQLACYQTALVGGSFLDNCSELHSYSTANDSNDQSYTSRNPSLSSAEHYYNFDQCDTKLKHQAQQEKLANNLHSLGQKYGLIDPYLLQALKSGQQNKLTTNYQDREQASSIITQRAYKKTSTGPQDELSVAIERYRLLSRQQAISLSNHNSKYLPERNEIVRIRSNVWGTKFKIINVSNRMISQRVLLGTVNYKASILHLQPRQIFLTVRDMSNYCALCSTLHHGKRSSFFSTSSKRHRNNSSDSVRETNDPRNVASSNIRRPIDGSRGNAKLCRHNDENKILLSVGDSLKIAPKLEHNQRYEQVTKGHLKQTSKAYFDNQLQSTRRNCHHNPTGNNRSIETLLGRRKSQKSSRPESRRSGRPEFVSSASSLSSTPLRLRNQSHSITGGQFSTVQSPCHLQRPASNCSSLSSGQVLPYLYPNSNPNPLPSTSNDNDDILTLSLCQGDKVKVELSSVSQIDQRPRALDLNQPSTSTSNQLDEFLDSNKTLKSIQTITKMIVDLSSRATNIEDSDDNIDPSSPSKLIKLSSPSNAIGQHEASSAGTRSVSRRFVPPETPVHRPRKIVNPDLVGASATNGLLRTQSGSQSAHSTPLKSRTRPSWRRNQSVDRDRQQQVGASFEVPMIPLPPPPEPVPISRRISSSAKRFLDGSLRSLYGVGGGSLGGPSVLGDHDPEPGEYEPLVSGSSYHHQQQQSRCSKRFQSQPTTPLKREQRKFVGEAGPSSRGDLGGWFSPSKSSFNSSGQHQQNSVDLSSLREQLFRRLRDSTTNWRSATASMNNNSHSKRINAASQTSDTQSELRNSRSDQKKTKRPVPALRGRLTPGASSLNHHSSQNISYSSGNGLDHEDDLDFDTSNSSCDGYESSESFDNQYPASSKYNPSGKLSFSAKTLNDLDKRTEVNLSVGWLKAKKVNQNNPPKQGQLKRRHRRHPRRKSICLNSSCCCANEFKLNNRPPVWNEQSQVYQLDFGGRVTQESAKNLQIDFEGSLALQFGRIDQCTYTLDFKHPFNAVQAMSIALASLTQRMK